MSYEESKSSKYHTNYLKYRNYYLEYQREHWPQYYQTHRKEISKRMRVYRQLNRLKLVKKDKEYYKKNREHKKAYNKEYRLKNLGRLRKHDRDYYWRNIEKIRDYREKNSTRIALKRKEYADKIKQEVLKHYSADSEPKCVVCSKRNSALLTIDHINESGAKERKRLRKKGGIDFYIWLKKNGFPAGYQVLCYNCNWLKRYKNNDTIRSRYSRRIKLDILSHYINSNRRIECSLCGEKRLELLTIDHIHGGGHREQQRIGLKGTEYYRHLSQLRYPPGFRILCMNCNVLDARSKLYATNSISGRIK